MEAQCCTCTARTGVDEDIHKLDAGQQIVVGTSTHVFSIKINLNKLYLLKIYAFGKKCLFKISNISGFSRFAHWP
jgi:hypothetical protein